MGTDRALEVLATGPLTLVQDLGRVGFAAVGVGRSGAADRDAFRLGARLLAQSYAAAALEVTLGGLSVRARGNVMLALTGAPAPADVDGRGVGYCGPFALPDGQILTLGTPRVGLRTYVSVRGGVNVPPVLGSRATDTLSGLGPEPLGPATSCRSGRRQPISPTLTRPRRQRCPARLSSCTRCPARETTGSPTRPRWPGPSGQPPVAATASGCALRVSRCSTTLSRRGKELPSEGVVRGSIQVPPGGEPVVFLADHPVTGGYPVVAVLVDDDIDRAAQAVPGQQIRIVLVGPSA